MRGGMMLVAAAAVLMSAGAARAADVGLTLIGGEVTGKARGQGVASVVAEVANFAGRELLGLRLAAYYSAVDVLPGDAADWRVHEFVFEPPLAPGDSTTLRFSDDNAAEYVLLEVRHTQFGRGLSFEGRVAMLEYGLLDDDGVTYVATRDLMNLIGGGISYDSETYEVVLERRGVELRFKERASKVKVDGTAQAIEHKILEVDGRSYLPLKDFAALFGLSLTHDTALNLLVLSES